MSDNLKIWNQCKQPPPTALKPIAAGRLKGKSDISPQWRYQIMTEMFGICGIGWKYEIVKIWSEQGNANTFAFAEIKLYVKQGENWSDAIPASGGSMLIQKESAGLHDNDEAYKMAITDALGTAMKMLGVAADVYMGLWDGSKYRDISAGTTAQSQKQADKSTKTGIETKSEGKADLLTVSELVAKMETAKNPFELKNRWTKYEKDRMALSGEDRVKVIMAKDKRKIELDEIEKAKEKAI